nr:immunoglobulin light chain junction region [Macaca mulatta]MOX79731.1 immunoglobulin light chain junction region [Macaca mulatta]MOX80001.1 immunoglobulin light chain junction region [Macaca mulatta]MOX80160.1 immunoglobulin light chain junction region [Macaca mulatta]MOX80399.1 immunoglobulin light chain junction region [Macaca mulatta]
DYYCSIWHSSVLGIF